jgi:hypothetical protein
MMHGYTVLMCGAGQICGTKKKGVIRPFFLFGFSRRSSSCSEDELRSSVLVLLGG